MVDQIASRESWLHSAIHQLRAPISAVGLTVPDIVHVSIGFPSKGALRGAKQRVGECWGAQCSADGFPHVFISPLVADGTRALDILLHELIHAAGIKDHRADFKRLATALGLEGKMTATVAGPELLACLNIMLGEIGPYPHQVLDPNSDSGRKKQTTRLLKAECNGCGALIRLTRKVIDDPGLPICRCGREFRVDRLDDEDSA